MWTSGDPNWGIYMSTSASGVSMGGGYAPASFDGRNLHHIRFRVAQANWSGFMWENSADVALMSLTGDTGNLYTRGQIYAGNSTSNVVWHAGNDGSGSGLDSDLLDGQHGSYYAAASSLNNYLPLTGGTLSGAVVVNIGNVTSDTVAFKVGGPGNYDSLTIGMEDTPDYDAFIASFGNDIRFYSGKEVATENHSFYWFTSKAGTSQHNQIAMVLDHNQNLSVTSHVYVSGGNSTQWNTAFGWGNHSGLYAPINAPSFTGNITLTGSHVNGFGILRIDSADDMLISTESASNGWNGLRLKNEGSEYAFFGKPSNQTDKIVIDFDFNSTNEFEFSNTGTLTVADRLIELSSIRYKTQVESLTPALDKVLQLRPVYYTKIGGTGSTEIGLIAEEVAEIYPELIKYNSSGEVDGISYTRLAPILIKTIQEQQELIKNLTKRIDDLENR
jgi:hypothetical protein